MSHNFGPINHINSVPCQTDCAQRLSNVPLVRRSNGFIVGVKISFKIRVPALLKVLNNLIVKNGRFLRRTEIELHLLVILEMRKPYRHMYFKIPQMQRISFNIAVYAMKHVNQREMLKCGCSKS